MKLEAVDRKNPHLVCVATIAAIDDTRSECWKIHFDGWTDRCAGALHWADHLNIPVLIPFPLFFSFALNRRSYDYWAEPNSSDLRPVGWCAQNSHALQAPRNYQFGAFTWESYLARESAEAVPAALLPGTTPGVVPDASHSLKEVSAESTI